VPSGVAGAIAESAGIRLELARRSWIHLGRDVVGQRTEAVVTRNRFGSPGRRAELEILYAEGDDRDACLARDGLLVEATDSFDAPDFLKPPVPGISDHATAPPLLAASAARPGAFTPILRVLPDRPRDRGRPAVDGRDRDRRGPNRARPRGAARDPAGERAPART
jgi:hypothetical protein